MWYWYKMWVWYNVPVILTTDDKLASYDRRTVTLSGIFESSGKRYKGIHTLIHFGKKRIQVIWKDWDDYKHLPKDGQEITVTGKLEWYVPKEPTRPEFFYEFTLRNATWRE